MSYFTVADKSVLSKYMYLVTYSISLHTVYTRGVIYMVDVYGFSPRSSESACGRWEKEVPLYT